MRIPEAQLTKFIEPSKSFNYAAVELRMVNLLSSLTVYLERMPASDKMAFVNYVRKPQGPLVDAVKFLKQELNSVHDRGGDDSRSRYLDMLQQVESFIRDAGEIEKQVILELLVGTPRIGLWHESSAYRDQVMRLLDLKPDTDHRVLLETHLEALPPYEHTIIISYLLSLQKEEGKPFDLVKVLEMFRAPGKKFADIAGVLGTFGPEFRDPLMRMKGWTLIPTRAEIYKWLKEVYPDALYRSIKDIHQVLGGGAIKVVVLVEFEDGEFEAVYIKRPHTDATNKSNISLARRWMGKLRERRGFENRYDFDYLLQLLETQLKMDTDFATEYKNIETITPLYLKHRPRNGWSWGALSPSKVRFHSDDVMHFTAVRGAVRYQDLSPQHKKDVAELILDTELSLLFDYGIFEAERTTANYLFVVDPDNKKHKVYAVDLPQVYQLKRSRYVGTDDKTRLARLIRAVGNADTAAAADVIISTCSEVDEAKLVLDAAKTADLKRRLVAVLSSGEAMHDKLVKVVAEVNRSGIRLPVLYSLGVVKALLILSNEDYAAEVPAAFVDTRVRGFVRSQAVREKVTAPLRWLGTTCYEKLMGGSSLAN